MRKLIKKLKLQQQKQQVKEQATQAFQDYWAQNVPKQYAELEIPLQKTSIEKKLPQFTLEKLTPIDDDLTPSEDLTQAPENVQINQNQEIIQEAVQQVMQQFMQLMLNNFQPRFKEST
ncbi:hypothetical protein VTO42DRAFT_1128 [Malbranchea cinnamomea]